jgi:GNAT superfamily N-acetyltransferase
MSRRELDGEVDAGVLFWGCEADGELVGVMGVQPVADVDLIRHAYVAPAVQGQGVGSALLTRLRGTTTRPMLVGTWAAAEWAIRFYQRHGFEPVPPDRIAPLLQRYWDIPKRQIETSVVLADRSFGGAG